MPARRLSVRRIRFAFILIAVLLLIAPSLALRATGQSSPAQGTAQVIAQGLTAPPADRVAWRIVEQPIAERIDARPSNRMQASAGFLLADQTPLFVADQRTKLRSRLSPGEAQFVPTGANQTWASLDDKAGTAYTLELVDRSVAKVVSDGELIFGGGSFSMKPGDYDMDLIRDDVPSGESAEVEQSTYPILIFATNGQVSITSSKSDEAVTLKAGEAASLRGDLVIKTRGKRTATYVAAILSDPVSGGDTAPTPMPTDTAKPEPRRTPTPESDPTKKSEPDVPGINDGASVRIAVRLCQDGMTVFNLVPSGCRRADGEYQLALVTSSGKRLRMSDASKVTSSFVRWSGLKAGEYVLVVGKMPEGYNSYSLDGFICCSTNDGYRIKVEKDQLIDGTLYLFTPAFGVGKPAPPTPQPVPQQPTNPAPGVDTDGDGLSDELEINVFGTSPFLVDSDGDTIIDGVEAFGTNGYLTAPALPDTDFDGVDDNVEIQQGTDPLDPGSF